MQGKSFCVAPDSSSKKFFFYKKKQSTCRAQYKNNILRQIILSSKFHVPQGQGIGREEEELGDSVENSRSLSPPEGALCGFFKLIGVELNHLLLGAERGHSSNVAHRLSGKHVGFQIRFAQVASVSCHE